MWKQFLFFMFLCIIIPVGGLWIKAGLDQSSIRIDMVVPTGYEGPILIRARDADGISMKEIRTDEGVYVIEVPPSGLVRLRGSNPFLRWVGLEVRYADGTSIPQYALNPDVPDDTTAFRYVAVLGNSGRESLFVIGKRVDVGRVNEQWRNGEWP